MIHPLVAAGWPASSPALRSPGCSYRRQPTPSRPRACERRNNNTYDKLLDCVTVEGVREHQAALQAIADANGGTRADQTPGYTASVDYVVETMTAAGWDVERVPFTFEVGVAEIEQLTPVNADVRDAGVHRDALR